MELTDVEVARAAVAAGMSVVRRDYGSSQVRRPKGGRDFATATDEESERAILAVVARHRPDDAVLGEETGAGGGPSTTRRWLVDPLCGTANFAAATPLAAVNVALEQDGQVRVAAAGDPGSGEVFWTDGHDAWRTAAGEHTRLVPHAGSRLVDISCDGPLDRPFVGGALVADPALRARFSPRVISSTLAVTWVAAGRRAGYVSDGRFDRNVHFAAGIALCRAAGCVVSDFDGRMPGTGRGLVVAADRATHASLLDIVEPHRRALEAGR